MAIGALGPMVQFEPPDSTYFILSYRDQTVVVCLKNQCFSHDISETIHSNQIQTAIFANA